MNILIYTPIAFEISETFILNQFTYQKKHNVIGISRKINNNIFFENKIYKISAIPVNFTDKVISYIVRKITKNEYDFSVFTKKRLKKIIKDNKIDVIHCNYGQSALRFIDIIKKTKVPLIVHFHGIDASKYLEDKKYVQKLPELFRIANRIIVVSDDMKQRLISYFSKDNFKKIEIIPYGIDFNKILNSKKENKDKNLISILHLGRITHKKGVLDLVKVFKEILLNTSYNLHLNIIGDGEQFDELKMFVNENKLTEYVTLHGALQHDMAIQKLANADIFVLNSRIAPNGDREGFPNVIIEAMAAGKAIVSTYHAGIPMAITNEKEGLLVDEKNNEQLQNALFRLINNSKERKILGDNAKEKALKHYTVERMINDYNKIYESI